MTPMEVRQLQVNEYAAQRNMPYDEAKTFLRGAEFADRTPRWVKVSDQLPAKVGNEYLVCDEDACICIASYEGDGEFYIYRNTAIKVSATHWQPLPGVPDEYYPEEL